MRVTLVNTLYYPYSTGGAARSVQELAEGLVRAGHDVQVLSLDVAGDEAQDAPQPETINGVVVERYVSSTARRPFMIGMNRPTLPTRTRWHIREALGQDGARFVANRLEAFGTEVLHTNNLAGFGTGAWSAAAAVPLVHTLRDYYLVCSRSQMYRAHSVCDTQCLRCTVFKSTVGIAQRRPDVFVGVSDDILARHRRLGVIHDDETTQTVYNWPELRVPRPVADRGDGRTVFGLLGRVGHDKGTWLAVEAYLDLPDSLRSRSVLRIAGPASRPEKRRLAALTDGTTGVEYVGDHVDPAAFYADISVALVPSQWYEPFGRVAAEARLAGVPVIASNMGGLAEALEQVGGGRLVDDFASPQAWSASMAAAMGEPGRFGGAVLAQGAAVVDQYLDIYSRAVRALA